MNDIVLISIPETTIKNIVEQAVKKALSDYNKQNVEPFAEYPENLTRSQVAEILRLKTVTTVDNWANDGRIKRYSIGRKIYFLKSEVLAAMKYNEKYRRT